MEVAGLILMDSEEIVGGETQHRAGPGGHMEHRSGIGAQLWVKEDKVRH